MSRSRGKLLPTLCLGATVIAHAATAYADPPQSQVLLAEPLPPDGDDGPSGLLIGGLSTLMSFYLAGGITGIAAQGEYDHTGWALIPLAGPFVAAGRVEPKSDAWISYPEVMRVGFIVAGVGQSVGAVLTVIGLAELSDDETTSAAVRVAPAAPGADLGLRLTGSF